jgi:adenylate cyclase class 2
MLEIEMKFAVEDFHAIEDALRRWHTSALEHRSEADRYFNAPDRDFARTDEALRIRSIGKRNFITYKGPKTDALTKTRTELEFSLGEGNAIRDNFEQLLQHLKYRFVALVEKQRTIYHLHRGRFDLDVCLDDVHGLGKFVELEIVAAQEQLNAARTVLLQLAEELGLKQSERRAYLQLLLEKQQCT